MLDLEVAAILLTGTEFLASLGIDATADNAMVMVSSEQREVEIHTPGQTALGSRSFSRLHPTDSGTLLVAFAPSAQRGDGLPGALLCGTHFRGEPSLAQIRYFITERWKIREYFGA